MGNARWPAGIYEADSSFFRRVLKRKNEKGLLRFMKILKNIPKLYNNRKFYGDQTRFV